jgi:hypothetical protein
VSKKNEEWKTGIAKRIESLERTRPKQLSVADGSIGLTKRGFHLTRRVVGLIVLSLGLASSYLSLLPRITVVEGVPLNSADPFSTPFVVSNDGPLGVSSFDFDCIVESLIAKGGNKVLETHVAGPKLRTSRMEVGERAMAFCPLNSAIEVGPIQSASIKMSASFRPDWVFWRDTRTFRFATIEDTNGTLRWMPVPIGFAKEQRNDQN